MYIFTCEQQASAVNDELKKAIVSLNKKVKKCPPKVIAKSIEEITTVQNKRPQRVVEQPTSEVVPQGQSMGPVPPAIMTTTQLRQSQ